MSWSKTICEISTWSAPAIASKGSVSILVVNLLKFKQSSWWLCFSYHFSSLFHSILALSFRRFELISIFIISNSVIACLGSLYWFSCSCLGNLLNLESLRCWLLSQLLICSSFEAICLWSSDVVRVSEAFLLSLLLMFCQNAGWKGWGEISYGGFECVNRAKAAEILVCEI